MDNQLSTQRFFKRLTTMAFIVACLVVQLGAFTRLQEAGLGCPDWPGCFGHLTPDYALKPMAEMIHRYFAGTLGLLVIGVALFCITRLKHLARARLIGCLLLLLIIMQSLLGMWTVTLKLHPTVVMGHLLGGFATLSLLWWLTLQAWHTPAVNPDDRQVVLPIAIVALLVLIAQIALGGWTSANYAALACPDFPQCQQQWLPALDFHGAFTFWQALGNNYEYGTLANMPRVTIHMMHRLGALITTLVLASAAIVTLRRAHARPLQRLAWLLLALLAVQVTLGISNVLASLPLPIAMAHNGVAALLLLTLIAIIQQCKAQHSDTQAAAIRDYIELCKPRVVLLMLLTALVGMLLATPHAVPWSVLLFGTIGIGLGASSAAVINHLADQRIDALMSRTRLRPIPSGRITPQRALMFAIVQGILAMLILTLFTNGLTAILTLVTLIGYALVYTLYLKRATPQNIVIGGITGAIPPLLGWSAVTGTVDPHALLLVLIIFVWTPPHFWALAIHRRDEYAKANIPMLPVTHGITFTKLSITLYTILLIATSLLPFVTNMSGTVYLSGALLLGLGFLYHALRLQRAPSSDKTRAMQTFRYSIMYLMLLFIVLLIDHYVSLFIV